MSNFLARCAAIAVVGGGFTATGDLGWLAARAARVVNARSVPSEQPAAESWDPAPAGTHPAPAPLWPPEQPSPPPLPPAADPFRGPPVARPVAAREPDAPPGGGPQRVEFAALRAGERVTLWIGRPPVAGRQPHLTLELVDPAAGEALLVGPGMAPRRVKVGTGRGGTAPVVAHGDTLVITLVGPAHHAGAAGETVGPVTAIAIGRR